MMVNLIVRLTLVVAFGFAAIGSISGQTYIQYVDSADNYIKVENWDKAEEMTIKALKKSPGNRLNYMLWSNLGDIRTRKEDYDGALQAFEIGLNLKPGFLPILCNRAYMYLSMGNVKNAMADLDEALRIDSVQEWPLNMKASLMYATGKYDEAEKNYKSLAKMFPENADAYSGLGKIEALKGNSIDAKKLLNKSLGIRQDEDVWFHLILLDVENENFKEAKDNLYTALKRYPRSGNLYLLRGLIHLKNYENDAADIDKKIAIENGADPQFVEKFIPRRVK